MKTILFALGLMLAQTSRLILPVTPRGDVHVYRNGLRLTPGIDYSISGAVVTFLAVDVTRLPQLGDLIVIDY